jgi:hypothetical protein
MTIANIGQDRTTNQRARYAVWLRPARFVARSQQGCRYGCGRPDSSPDHTVVVGTAAAGPIRRQITT